MKRTPKGRFLRPKRWPFVTCWLSGVCDVVAAFAAGVQRAFFRFGGKHLQNSLRIQEIFIKFASIMGLDVFYVTYLLSTMKVLKIFHFHNFFQWFP